MGKEGPGVPQGPCQLIKARSTWRQRAAEAHDCDQVGPGAFSRPCPLARPDCEERLCHPLSSRNPGGVWGVLTRLLYQEMRPLALSWESMRRAFSLLPRANRWGWVSRGQRTWPCVCISERVGTVGSIGKKCWFHLQPVVPGLFKLKMSPP